MKKTLFFFWFLSSLLGVQAQGVVAPQIQVLNAMEFNSAISSQEVQLVDVRTPKEYLAGYIKNAVNIDFYQSSTFEEAFNRLDKNEPVYLYCRSGRRSKYSAKKLIEMGFLEVYDLKGGYLAWKSKQ